MNQWWTQAAFYTVEKNWQLKIPTTSLIFRSRNCLQATIQMKNLHNLKIRTASSIRRERIFLHQILTVQHDEDHSNKNKQAAIEMQIQIAIWVLQQGTNFPSRNSAPWFRHCKPKSIKLQAKWSREFKQAQNSKSFLDVKTERELSFTTKNTMIFDDAKKKKKKKNYVCKKVDLLSLGIWWSWQSNLQSGSHQSNLNTTLHPNSFFVFNGMCTKTEILDANCEKKMPTYAASMNIWTTVKKKSQNINRF